MISSIEVAKAATRMAISSRDEEKRLSEDYIGIGIKTVAVDFGGNLHENMQKILERALVASKRTTLIKEEHLYEGAVIGATRDAIMQVASRAASQNVGGKIGIARSGEHLSVCIFLSIGLLHLNEVVIGIGHRAIPS